MSFSANLYADRGSENVVLWVHQSVPSFAVLWDTAHCGTPSSLKLLPFWELSQIIESEFQSILIEQFFREKRIWIRPVPSEILAKQIFPKLRCSITRPARAISLVGVGITSSIERKGERVHSSIFAELLVRISQIVCVELYRVANGFTPSDLILSSFLMRSRVSVE